MSLEELEASLLAPYLQQPDQKSLEGRYLPRSGLMVPMLCKSLQEWHQQWHAIKYANGGPDLKYR
jgi:hypothetical protein